MTPINDLLGAVLNFFEEVKDLSPWQFEARETAKRKLETDFKRLGLAQHIDWGDNNAEG